MQTTPTVVLYHRFTYAAWKLFTLWERLLHARLSEALIESRQFIGWWRDTAPDTLTSSAYTGERAIYSSDFSAFTKRPYCPSVTIFWPQIIYFGHGFSVCTLATAYSGTLFSSWWSAMEYRRCQLPCARFIASDDPHSKCVKCLGFSHAREAVYGIYECKFCEYFHLKTLRSRLEVLETESSVFPRRATEAIDPVNCPIGPVLEFLQERLTAGAAATTLRVYVAAIVARRELDEIPLGRHRMVSAFMRGVRRLRPTRPTAVHSWDLSVVLEGLVTAPFEPLESAPEWILLRLLFCWRLRHWKKWEICRPSLSVRCVWTLPRV